MEAKTVRPEAKAIQDRFFKVLNQLIETGKVKNLQSFCRDYDLHRPKYSRLRTQTMDPDKIAAYKFIDIDSLGILVKNYKVSGDWLLTGKGKEFK
jgi:hypothetical protein